MRVAELNRIRSRRGRGRPRRVLAAGVLGILVGVFAAPSPAAAADSVTLSVTVMVDTGEEDCGTASQIEVDEGTVVRWCYVVRNTGEGTLTHHDLQSSVFGALLTDHVLTLVPGATTTITATGAVTADTVDQATWTASNPQGGVTVSDSASATVNRIVDNTAPEVADARYTTTVDQPLAVAAPGLLTLASDPDGDPLTIGSGQAATDHGVVDIRPDGSFTYTPGAGFEGSDRFTFAISDGTVTVTGIVTVVVNAGPPVTNPPPTVTPPPPGSVPAPVPVPPTRPGGPSTPGAPGPGRAPELPASGAEIGGLPWLALGLIGAGAASMAAARRRPGLR